MKRVINITLNSIVFAIEQDAYDVLDAYLDQIKNRLAGSADQTEIMSDVESAMAEKFIALGRSERIGVGLRDVEKVRSDMGSPSDFGESSDSVDNNAETESDSNTQPKRLFRDTDDAVIAGIASGIARYFSIDPVIVRIIFIVAIFVNGIGALAYLILWLVVPAARTTADKFAMQGKRVTVEDIAQKVKKNLDNTPIPSPEVINSTWQKVRSFLQQIFLQLGRLFRLLLVLLRYLVGTIFVAVGALGTAALVSVYSVVLLSEKNFPTARSASSFRSHV